jgi:type I restriction enzyme S subunit
VLAGNTPSKSNAKYWGGSYPWASAKDMKSRDLIATEDGLTELGWREATIAPRGATLIVVRGMILAHSFPVTRCMQPTAFNQDIRALVPRDSLEAEYLTLWAEWASPWFLSNMGESSHGTKRLVSEALLSAAVPLPLLKDQRMLIARQMCLLQASAHMAQRADAVKSIKSALLGAAFERS